MIDNPDTLLELARFICGREDADSNASRLARGYRDLHERLLRSTLVAEVAALRARVATLEADRTS